MSIVEIYRNELVRRLNEARREAMLSAMKQARAQRPLTLGDLVECMLDDSLGEFWLDDSDDLAVGEIVGDASYSERVVDLLSRLVPAEVDPDDPVLGLSLTGVSAC